MRADAQLLAVSVDSVYSHEAFSEELGIEYPLLSDFNREVVQAYGVAYDEIGGLEDVAKRAVFVIDKDRIVRYKWVSEDPSQLPDVNEVLKAAWKLRDTE